jgi:tetratricopeptide (TPR) repeat protein
MFPALAIAGDAMEPDDLPEPQSEIVRGTAAVELPVVPAFELAPADPGVHRPRELRVRGRRMLGSEIRVMGYVTWIYDCVNEIWRIDPAAKRAQIRQAIENDPTLCSQPKFTLGDSPGSARDASIWIADMPTQLRLATGDHVVVTGTWTTRSQHAEHDTEGLLVFRSIERAAEPATPVTLQTAAATAAAIEPEVTLATAPPLRKVVDEQARNISIALLNACNKAIAARRYADAITQCRAATGAWNDNHLAWYAWASAHLARNEWQAAQTAIARAVAQRPDRAMYQLYDGIARYEAAIQKAREDRAHELHKPPEDVTLDPSRLSLDPARDALLRAVRIAPDLWRAHYYLGRLYRDLEDARHAAERFTRAIAAHPGYRLGYIALTELYRRWGYLDQSLAVALRGAAHVRATEAADLWFEIGLTYDAKHLEDKAIAAFGKVLDTRPRDLNARFQRGQIYVRRGDFADARLDLEEVVTSTDPQLAAVQPIAQQLLRQMAVQDQLASQPRPRPAGRAVKRFVIPKPITPSL